VNRSSFVSMGTRVDVLTEPDVDAPAFARALEVIRSRFAEEDARFSRFRDDSELCALNARRGRWVPVSAPFLEVLELSLRAAHDTGGLFDPTALAALEGAGYDRDFAAIDLADDDAGPLQPIACGGWRDVRIRDGRVLLPAGVGVDLGGLVKGWTADRAAEAAVDAGLPWVLVNAGGDLRVAGDAPAVPVGIEEPTDPDRTPWIVRLEGGALATTSTTTRRWAPGRHQVIDPRTGLPADVPAVQATVWAPSCAEAEVGAKRALLAGSAALAELPGLLVLDHGTVAVSLPFEEAA
jgi:thiamine biosynthesis lipoprotein